MKDHSQLILEYLVGNLKKKEVVKIEEMLRSDRKLQRELEWQRDMIATLKAREQSALKAELKTAWRKIKQDIPTEENPEKDRVIDIKKLKKFALQAAAGLAAAGLFLSHFGGAMGQSSAMQQEEEEKHRKKKKKK